MSLRIAFDNSYARLPDRFHARLDPTPVAAPRLVRLNTKLAEDLGIDPLELTGPEGVAVLAGNRPETVEPLRGAEHSQLRWHPTAWDYGVARLRGGVR